MAWGLGLWLKVRDGLTICEERGNCKCKNAIPEPIRRRGEGYGLCADFGWVYLAGICPTRGAPCRGECTDEQVGHSNHRFGNRFVVMNDPGNVGIARRPQSPYVRLSV